MSNLSEIPTCELVEELKNREGVESFEIAPYEEKYVIKKYPADGYSFCDTRLDKHGDKGGTIILEVID